MPCFGNGNIQHVWRPGQGNGGCLSQAGMHTKAWPCSMAIVGGFNMSQGMATADIGDLVAAECPCAAGGWISNVAQC